MDNLGSEYTLVYNWVVIQSFQEDSCNHIDPHLFVVDLCTVHKDWDHKDHQQQPVLQLNIFKTLKKYGY